MHAFRRQAELIEGTIRLTATALVRLRRAIR